MQTFRKKVLVCGSLCFLFFAGVQLSLKAQETGIGMVFGFCDTTGTKILVIEGDSNLSPDQFVMAYADGGQKFEVVFLGIQEGNDQDNGRRMAYNFYNCAGYLYQVKSGAIHSEATIVLITAAFAASHLPLAWVVPDKEVLPPGSKDIFFNDKKQVVQEYKCIGTLNNGKLFVVQFRPKADSVTASLVYFNGGTAVFRDYTALVSDNSTWRVDDGGQFGVDYYHILAVFLYQGNIEVVTDWIGAEGYSTEFMKQDGNEFIPILNGYRYSSPL